MTNKIKKGFRKKDTLFIPDGKGGFLQVNATTIREKSWKQLDTAIMKSASKKLVGAQDLIREGLVFDIDGFPSSVLMSEKSSDAMTAKLDMNGASRGESGRIEYSDESIPLPIIHVDYDVDSRTLEITSKNKGNLASLTYDQVGYAIADSIEKSLFTDIIYASGDSRTYSYLNYPHRIDADHIKWDGALLHDIKKDVIALKQRLIDKNFFGPYALYIPSNYEDFLDQDYDDLDVTFKEILEGIGQIKYVHVSYHLPDSVIILVELKRETIRLVNGLPLTTIKTESECGMSNHFKSLTIQVPQIRSDFDNNCGLVCSNGYYSLDHLISKDDKLVGHWSWEETDVSEGEYSNIYFDGQYHNAIIPGDTYCPLDSDWTVTTLTKLGVDNGNIYQFVVSFRHVTHTLGITWDRFNGGHGWSCYFYDGSDHYINATEAQSSGWCRLVMTYQADTQKISFYVNGELIGYVFGNGTTTTLSSPGNKIAGYFSDSYYSNIYVADVGYYSRCVPASEIAAFQGRTINQTGLVSYWPFEEGAGTTIKDVIGGNDATLTDGDWNTVPVTTIIDQSDQIVTPRHLTFNGTSSGVDLGPNTIDTFNGSTDFSIILHVKELGGSVYGSGATGDRYVEFGDDLLIRIKRGITQGFTFSLYDGAYHTINATEAQSSGWCIVVCTFDLATLTMRLYVNQTYIGSTTISDPDYVINRSNFIGCGNDGRYANCGISELAIFDYELSEACIQNLKFNNISKCSPIHYWNFEDTGNTLTDVVGSVNGTITDGTWVAETRKHFNHNNTSQKPVLEWNHIRFNGNSLIETIDFALKHDNTVYLVVDQLIWGSANCLLGGLDALLGTSFRIMQYPNTPAITMDSAPPYSNISESKLNEKQVIIMYRSASVGAAFLRINNQYETFAAFLYSTEPGGITLGGVFSTSSTPYRFTNMKFYDLIIRSGQDSDELIQKIFETLQSKYKID